MAQFAKMNDEGQPMEERRVAAELIQARYTLLGIVKGCEMAPSSTSIYSAHGYRKSDEFRIGWGINLIAHALHCMYRTDVRVRSAYASR